MEYLVGNAVGEQNINLVRKNGFTAIHSWNDVDDCFSLVFILFRNYLPYIYIRDEVVIKIASQLLVIAALFQLSDGIQAVGIGILRGLTDVKVRLLLHSLRNWV